MAINTLRNGGKIQEVRSAHPTQRKVKGYSHFGTKVVMWDESEYVFDWFPTLEPENPIIYRSHDWVKGREGTAYEDFTGFDLPYYLDLYQFTYL